MDEQIKAIMLRMAQMGATEEEIREAIEVYKSKMESSQNQNPGEGDDASSEAPAGGYDNYDPYAETRPSWAYPNSVPAEDGRGGWVLPEFKASPTGELSKEEKKQAKEMASMLRLDLDITTSVISNKKNKNSQAIANALGIDIAIAQEFVNDEIDYKALSGHAVKSQDKKEKDAANNKYHTGNRGHITEDEYNDYSFGFSESGRIKNLEEVYGSPNPNEGFEFTEMAGGVAAIRVRNKKNGKEKVFTSGFGRTLDMDWNHYAGDIENVQEVIDFIESSNAKGEDEDWTLRTNAVETTHKGLTTSTVVKIIDKGTGGFTSDGTMPMDRTSFDRAEGVGGYWGEFGKGNKSNLAIEEAQRPATAKELNLVVDFTKQTIRKEIRNLFNSQKGFRLEVGDREKEKIYEDVFRKINAKDNGFGFLISRAQYDAIMGGGATGAFLSGEIASMGTVFKTERAKNIRDNTTLDEDFRNDSHQSILDGLPSDFERNKVISVQEARPLENRRRAIMTMIKSGHTLGDNPKPLSDKVMADIKLELKEINKDLDIINRDITANASESWGGIGKDALASRLFEGGDSEEGKISKARANAIAAAYTDAETNAKEEVATVMANNPSLTQREAMSQWYENLILEEQAIASSGSTQMLNVNLSNMTSAARKKIIEWHRDANPDFNWDDAKYKLYGGSYNTDGSWKGLDVPVGVMLDLGFDPRYFTGGSAAIRDNVTAILHGDVKGVDARSILSEKDALALSSYENAVDENYGRRKAAFDMAYLDIDPEDIDAKEHFWSDSTSWVGRILDEGNVTIKTQWLDYSEREARESLDPSTSAAKRRTLDRLQSTAADFNRDNEQSIISGEMAPLTWNEDQLETFERNLAENVAVGVGEFVPTLIELAALTIATQGVLSTSRAAVYLARIRGTGIWGKLQYHLAHLLAEEAKMKVAGFKTGSGAAFYAGGALTPWFRPSFFLGKRAKGFDALFAKTIKPGVVGAASGELAAITELRIESAMGLKDFDYHMHELYGDNDVTSQRILTNALVFATAAQMGKGRIKFQDLYVTPQAKLRLRNNLGDKIEATMRKPDVQKELEGLEADKKKLEKDYKNGDISEAKYEMESHLLDWNVTEIKSNKNNYRKLEDLGSHERRRVQDLSGTMQSVNHLFAAQTRDVELSPKNPDGSNNKNFEGNYKRVILDPINTILQKINPGQKPVTVRFVEGKEAERIMDKGNLAEFDPVNNELIFNKSEYTAGKSNHELVHMALRQVFKGRGGDRMEVKFEERLDKLFEEAYGKGLKDMMNDYYGEGGLSAAVFEGYKSKRKEGETIKQQQEREMSLRQEEYMSNLAEFITNPEVYYSQVNNTFLKNAKAEVKSFMEETMPGIDKMFSRDMTKDMTAHDFINLLGRMGADAGRGVSIKGKIKKLANLQDVTFLGIEYVEATKPKVMASRDLKAENADLKTKNLTLFEKKKSGEITEPQYKEQVKKNADRIRANIKNIEIAEKNVDLIKEYSILKSEANLEKAGEIERLKLSRKFEQLRENNSGILENYIGTAEKPGAYKEVPGSSVTRDMFKEYVYYTEFPKLLETYLKRGGKDKNVEFGAYLQLPNTLALRTGNILKGLGQTAESLDIRQRTGDLETARDIAAPEVSTKISVTATEGIELIFKLPVEQTTIDAIGSKVEGLDLNNLNYKTLQDLMPGSTKAMFGKSTQAKANFIANNWKTLYNALPKNLTETTGTATGIENALMTRVVPKGTKGAYEVVKKNGDVVYMKNVFYEATGQDVKFAKTGASTGTGIQRKIEMNKTQFLAELGIKDNRVSQDLTSGEGKVDISGMNVKLDRGITTSVLPALINQTGKAISNQVVRSKLQELVKTRPELFEAVEKFNIETLLSDIASGKSDKLAAKDIAKEYRRSGINKKTLGISQDVGFFTRDMLAFLESNPREYEIIKDVIEDHATVEAEIGRKNEIAFTKETKKLEGDWAQNGSWRTSEAKFKNDPALVKEFVDNNFEIAELINLPENAASGNMKMMLDMFTGHYSVLRGSTTFDKVGSPFKVGLKKRVSNGKSTLPQELQDRFTNINSKALKSSYNGYYKTAFRKINEADGNKAKQKEIARETFKSETAEAQLEFYDLFNSVLQHWVHSSPKGSAEFNRKMNHVARMKKHNSSIGTSGERVLAPVGWVHLPSKVVGGKVKYEHLKSSSQQSFETLALIAENRWGSEGRNSLQNYEGVYGFLHDFNIIDKATGKVNSSGIFRLAESLELAKDIYSTKSNFEKSLYQEMVEQVGEKKIKEMLKNEKQLDTQHEAALGKMGSKELSKTERLELMSDISRAIANSKLSSSKRRGMSTWDFDDTLASTKSGVRARIPNPSGSPKPGRKVIFMAGGAGSGKGGVIKGLGLEKAGYKIVNSDISLEWLKKNNGLPENQVDYTAAQRSSLSKLTGEARRIAKRKQGKFAGVGDGVVVDGTGGSVKVMKAKVQEFKDKGYDVSMVFVETSLEVAQKRNAARKDRTLREGILNKNHEQVQGNKEAFKELFGENYNEVLTDKLSEGEALPKEFKSKIDKFTNSYENRRLDAEEFAKEGSEIKDRGGEFDFTEFNKVTGGEAGPFLEKALERAKKFGTKDQFVLTARAAEAAPAIHEFLKSQGLDIPLENITGLGNSAGSAKARWMLKKFSEGYNDMYFADDAMQNVKAVKYVLDRLDIKSDVQQARKLASVDISKGFNEMIERKSGIGAEKTFSGAKGKMLGKRRWSRSLVVPGAQDFMGLMQNFIGKGKQGNKDLKFFEDNLVAPFARSHKTMNEARQRASEDLKAIYKHIPSVKKKLNKNIENSPFTHDQAIRVYLWEKAGLEIPELSKKDIKRLTDVVRKNPEMLAFADGLKAISKGEWVKPSDHWVTETIVSDLFNLNNRSNRSKFLAEWIENKDIIFSEKNLNKIEATQGTKFREALEDILYRMETGSNRPSGSNKLANAHMNFINGSVGATMFLNMRSAALQTISATNYINWGENNPLQAAKAFGNQKQYWKDFSMLWNSPMLKQRRAGLEYNVQEAELAAAVAGQKNKAKAAMAWLIKKGFTPTQLADSFAIASGGSTFYRNRVKMYEKKGLNPTEARKKAFLDFQEKTETNQQSSRADLISQQQSSTLGRTVLAWANTPMQYMRIQEKASRNLINGRGDFKTNVSQVAYYGIIQSLIFASLQSALFAYGLDDEEDMDTADLPDRVDRVINTVIDGQLRGMGVGGAAVSAIKNTILEFQKQELKADDGEYFTEPDHVRTLLQLTGYSPVISSKLRKLYSAGNTWNWNREVISEMGLDLNNPAIEAGANVIEAVTNFPLARLVRKIDNLKEVADSENQIWQRIAQLMGYSSWDVGTEDESMIAVKAKIKEDKVTAAEVKKDMKKLTKDAEKLADLEELEESMLLDQDEERESGQEDIKCAALSKSGKRCGKDVLKGDNYCTIHENAPKRADGEKTQCTHIKSDKKRCKMKTANQSGKCYYHD